MNYAEAIEWTKVNWGIIVFIIVVIYIIFMRAIHSFFYRLFNPAPKTIFSNNPMTEKGKVEKEIEWVIMENDRLKKEIGALKKEYNDRRIELEYSSDRNKLKYGMLKKRLDMIEEFINK